MSSFSFALIVLVLDYMFSFVLNASIIHFPCLLSLSSFQGLSSISCLEDEAVENYTNIPDYKKLQRKLSHVVPLINIGDAMIVVKGTCNLSCPGCIMLVILQLNLICEQWNIHYLAGIMPRMHCVSHSPAQLDL